VPLVLFGRDTRGLLKSPLELSYARIPPSYHGLVLHGRGAAGRGVRPRGSGACWVSPYPKSPFVFTSERGAPFTTAGFARMIERAGEAAGLDFKAHPHMLRHACGFALANKGHDTRALQAYLGHKNIQHTVRYTELAPDRFKDFWR
jgi:integrase